MKENRSLGKVQIPSYVEVFDELASGFGLIESKQNRLASQRSWQGRQSRYGPKNDQPWRGVNHGLVGELILLLAGNDLQIADELANYLHNVEAELAYLRGTALFTRRSYRFGLGYFLGIFAFPQISHLLWRLRDRLPKSSPLYYVKGLLPKKDQEGYDSAVMTRNKVREILDEIPEIKTTDFRRSLSKVSTLSDVKLKNIEFQIEALNLEAKISSADDSTFQKIAQARAAYIAGVAIQRFLGRLADNPSGNAAGFLGLIHYHLTELDLTPDYLKTDLLYNTHKALASDMASPGDSFVLLMFAEDSPLSILQDLFDEYIKPERPDHCLPLMSALGMMDDHIIYVATFENLLSQLRQDTNFDLYEPHYKYLVAHLHLAQTQATEALSAFDSVLDHCATQQLGDLAVTAAQYAIVLKIISDDKWINGCLDPWVAHIAINKVQKLEFKIGMPTPFSSFASSPVLTGSTVIIFESIRTFNCEHRPIIKGSRRLTCNPFYSLEKHMDKFFSTFDECISRGESEQDAIKTSVNKTFNNTARSRSVFRMHRAVPYEVIRDLFFYTRAFFGEKIFIHEFFNPSINRYMLLAEKYQLLFLESLDGIQFKKDSESQD